MELITLHSIEKASEQAVKLWALSSAQYPLQNRHIQETVEPTIVEVLSSFSLNARRSMEVLPPKVKYPLTAARWKWKQTKKGEKVVGLWDALNRIIHAKKLIVGFERLPENVSVIDGGAIAIPYIQAETDRKELAFIDPFSVAHAYLYNVLPSLIVLRSKQYKGESRID